MNKRIAELVKEAGEYVDNNYSQPIRANTKGKIWEAGHVGWSDRFNEKFAQLLIKDCLKIVERRTKGPYDIAMTQETRNAWNTWIEIKEHFGVKDDI